MKKAFLIVLAFTFCVALPSIATNYRSGKVAEVLVQPVQFLAPVTVSNLDTITASPAP